MNNDGLANAHVIELQLYEMFILSALYVNWRIPKTTEIHQIH